MIERLFYAGVTHKTAAVAVRERMVPTHERIEEMLDQLRSYAAERLVLSTCCRFELYVVASADRGISRLEDLAAAANLPIDALRGHLRVLRGPDAAAHCLRVAAGLESQLIGEGQVLGQLRAAFELASSRRAVGPILSALFRSAIHAGKRVRHETAINQSATSYAHLAVERVRQALGPTGGTVLILGAGGLAECAASLLAKEDRYRIVIVSRHLERAARLAKGIGASVGSIEQLPSLLNRAAAVFGCASSSRFLLEASAFKEARLRRGIVVFDMAVPRNVDPAVGNLPGVDLEHLDMMAGDHSPRIAAIVHAERIIGEELSRLHRWTRCRRDVLLAGRTGSSAEGAAA